MNFIDSDAFENALSQFETYIQEADLYDFQRTTLTDVWEAARVIERDREQHKRMRSQKRIEIFLQKLGILGDVAQKIHLDVTKVCYLWVCFVIKVCLRLETYISRLP